MGRSPSISGDDGLKKGPWSPEEDEKLIDYINKHGHGSWQALPKKAGLNRCGKSCRLRWTNYLRPDIKRGRFSDDEEDAIIRLHSIHGNKWSTIASHLPGRTDNEIKNYWNTHLRKKLIKLGIDPKTHKPIYDFNLLSNLSQMLSIPNMYNLMNPVETVLSLQADVAQVATSQLLQNILQIMNSSTLPNNLQENFALGLNNFPHFDGLVNGSSPRYSVDPLQWVATLPGAGDVEQLLNTLNTNANSPGFPNGVFSSEIPVNGVKNFTDGCCTKTEYSLLPALVPASPGTSNFNQMDSIDNTNYIPPRTFQSSFFDDDWNNTVDNEENICFWKDIIP